MVELKLSLTNQEAWDLAQLVKRFGFSDALNCAADETEAYRMIYVVEKIQRSLENKRIQSR